jgi:hypothetical protein
MSRGARREIHLVIPAKAGTQLSHFACISSANGRSWAPAFAGVTVVEGSKR